MKPQNPKQAKRCAACEKRRQQIRLAADKAKRGVRNLGQSIINLKGKL